MLSVMALLHCHFFSETLTLAVSMYVILPEASRTGKRGMRATIRHPTLLLLHGLSDDHTIWIRRTAIERYATERGLAVVMPAAGRSYYQDMAAGPRYWTFISEEVPRAARAFFPLSSARQDNFGAGLSMGGYGAFRLALSFPDRYAAAASLSGALDIVARYRCALREQTPYTRTELRSIFGSRPRLGGSPADLFQLARRVARGRRSRPRLYQYCGTADFLYADNLRFRDHARRLGLELTYVEDAGDHQWRYWDEQIARVIKWLPLPAV